MKLDARQCASCLYGLQKLTPSDPHVLQLVDALATKIRKNLEIKDQLNAQAVSNMLYGLQGLSTNFQEVRRLLVALATVCSRKQRLSAQGTVKDETAKSGSVLAPWLVLPVSTEKGSEPTGSHTAVIEHRAF